MREQSFSISISDHFAHLSTSLRIAWVIGTVSGFLLWHSVLLEVLAGGVALITVIVVAGQALTNRKEEVSHGSKIPASESLSARGA